MKVVSRSIADLTFDPQNARRHGKKNKDAVLSSLKKFGQQKPIVILSDGTVIAGNATTEAATTLGWDKIDAVVFDGTKDEAIAFAIADNRTAELATWDWDILTDQLNLIKNADGLDLLDVGFTIDEAGAIIGGADLTAVPDDELKKQQQPPVFDAKPEKIVIELYEHDKRQQVVDALQEALKGLPVSVS